MTDLVVCSKKFLSEKAVDAVELSTRQKPLQRIIQCEAEQNFYLMDSVPQHWRLVPVVLFFTVCAHFKPPQGTIPSGHIPCKSFYDQLKFPNRKFSFLHIQIGKNSVG